MDPVIHASPTTAQEEAYRFLLSTILTGKYPGGTRLNLDEVAAAIGVSRMPVREAIRQLSAEGLVTIRPNRGATVTELMPDDVLELFEMRGALEALAVRVALPRLDAEALQDLEQLVERMNRRRGNAAQWLRDHDEFHDYVCRRSGRARLVELTRRLRRTVEPYLRVHVGVYDPPEMLESEHARLIEVFRSGDV
jgi:DNA-binding GntR family transcriptional regulator